MTIHEHLIAGATMSENLCVKPSVNGMTCGGDSGRNGDLWFGLSAIIGMPFAFLSKQLWTYSYCDVVLFAPISFHFRQKFLIWKM